MRNELLSLLALPLLPLVAGQASGDHHEMPIVAEEDFEEGAKNWEIKDPKSWRVAVVDGNKFLSQHVKPKSYEPPHRSPFHVALLKRPKVTDFELTLRVRSTHEDYGHRDACLFFGYQDPAHFYYAHLGKKADPHCNQIFIVNEADRTKITTTTTEGTNWTDDWHKVRIVRRVAEGAIEVFFDDMKKPAMTAKDDTFIWGRVGVGSFDDTADFDDLVLRGVVPTAPVEHHDYPEATRRQLLPGPIDSPPFEISPEE